VGVRSLLALYVEAFRNLPADALERAVLSMTIGLLDKDSRRMMTDGEALRVTAGPWAIWDASGESRRPGRWGAAQSTPRPWQVQRDSASFVGFSAAYSSR
jgi:hypothetical protein